jgi:hypothetical protein
MAYAHSFPRFGRAEFQKINQQLTKAQGLGEAVPNFYVRIIVQLSQLVEDTFKDKDKVKKMSKTNAKSFNAMRQNVKKNNATYEDQIAKFQEVRQTTFVIFSGTSRVNNDSKLGAFLCALWSMFSVCRERKCKYMCVA